MPRDLSGLRVAVVLDPFSYASFGPECELCPLHPLSWADQIRAFNPHLLLVESAWTGLDGEWRGLVERAPAALRSLLGSCRASGIPTVFWSKEDPVHFEAFIETARLFDQVFTTDAQSIPRYRHLLGHDRVGLLSFALQPRLHHPVQEGVRSESAVFAGAWYGKMPERCRDFEAVADALMLAGSLRIHDRNSGTGELFQRFPDRFSGCVFPRVGYEETPAMYRAHRIGLNLNTVKQSPTMFARRVLELIGCNTSVYGNYSLALHQLFGDLTVSSDDPERIFEEAWREFRDPDALRYRHRRLEAMRKVLREHTWSQRMRTIVQSVSGSLSEAGLGRLWVAARVETTEQLEHVAGVFMRQCGVDALMLLDMPESLPLPDAARRLGQVDLLPEDWIAVLHPRDYYGPHYLEDLSLGRLFRRGDAVGKGAWFALDASGEFTGQASGREYRVVGELALRRCLARVDRLPLPIDELLRDVDACVLRGPGLVALDMLSYVENGAGHEFPELEDGVRATGIGFDQVASFAARTTVDVRGNGGEVLDGHALSRLFNDGIVPARTSVVASGGGLEVCSVLEDGESDAIFSAAIRRGSLERNDRLVVGLDAPGAGRLEVYLDAIGSAGDVLQRLQLHHGADTVATPLAQTSSYRLSLGVAGALVAHVGGLWIGGVPSEPLLLPGRGRLLLVTNGYPESGTLYRNAFLHRRVLAYLDRGVPVDVVCVRAGERQRSYEFEGVLVHVCSPGTLAATVAISDHAAIAVHFLDEAIWEALRDAASLRQVVVWLHGSEIQSWRRRLFNHRSDSEIEQAMRDGERRTAFWRTLLQDPPPGLRLVFVSRTFAEETWEDLGLELPRDRWSVIHNPIDTHLFQYRPKSEDQRLRILSIRPHDYRIYANDLVADAIHELARLPLFGSLRFTLVGDGKLWAENFSGLAQYPNVELRQGFLSQQGIADLHRSHGVFLVPTRGDTQGVSRDEAMASGLVPVTCRAGSVPEFVDEASGIVCPVDDPSALGAAIMRLCEHPGLFHRLSEGAARRVRMQSMSDRVIVEELSILGVGPTGRTMCRPA